MKRGNMHYPTFRWHPEAAARPALFKMIENVYKQPEKQIGEIIRRERERSNSILITASMASVGVRSKSRRLYWGEVRGQFERSIISTVICLIGSAYIDQNRMRKSIEFPNPKTCFRKPAAEHWQSAIHGVYRGRSQISLGLWKIYRLKSFKFEY